MVKNRYKVSLLFKEQLERINKYGKNKRVGDIDLRLGSLDDPAFEGFQTDCVTRVYINNFNGVFSERSDVRKVGVYPDHVVAGLFTKLKPGSILVSFYPLPLGPDRDQTNDLRRRAGLEESDNASFFKYEKIALGKAYDCVKWKKESRNKSIIWVYRYTRLEQTEQNAVFLCINSACSWAKDQSAIPATDRDDVGRCISRKHCIACLKSAHSTRNRKLTPNST
jgi:hypothetical protein